MADRIEHGHWPAIAALGLLAGTVRWVAWLRTAAMHNDGPLFIGLARLMDEGDWTAALAHPYHPLYPISIWLTHGAGVSEWEAAGALVSIVAGAFSVVALAVFLRDAVSWSAAWVGALALAVHPYAVAFSSDVQSDGLYLALFLGAIALVWSGLERGSLPRAAGAGGLAGLAYLTRPEGLGVVAVAGLFVALHLLQRRWSLPRASAWGAALLLAAAALASPYVWTLHAQTGGWVLTQKKSIERDGLRYAGAQQRAVDDTLAAAAPFLETVVEGPRAVASGGPLPAAPPLTAWERRGRALVLLGTTFWSTFRPELQVLLVLGLVARWRGREGPFVLAFALLYGAVLFALASGAGYVSRRHVLPVAVLAFGYVGAGAPIAGRWALRGWQWLRATLRPSVAVGGEAPRAGLATALGLLLIVGVAVPKTLKVRRLERLAERRAAEWLGAQPERLGPVAAEKQRVAYYADAPYVPLPRPGVTPVMDYLRASGARYVIADEQQLARNVRLRDATRRDMREVHRAAGGGREASVFVIEAESGS